MRFLILFLFLVSSLQATTIETNLSTLRVKLHKMGVPDNRINIKKLYGAISRCKVDQNLLLSIIRVESAFKVNAYNKKSKDYGLMQVNEWHVKRKKLKKALLLSDIDYNIHHGCQILKWFVSVYPFKEAIGRYNAGTGSEVLKYPSVKRYMRLVLKHYKLLGGIK